MPALLTDQEFADQFREFRCAFRLEAEGSPRLGYEREEYELFCAGNPRPPSAVPWWQDFLDRVRGWTQEGRAVVRVRLEDAELTPYQRWLAWCEPWHLQAGDLIKHLPRSAAASPGIPGYDFWLFDDDRLVILLFGPDGDLTGRILITSDEAPDLVAQHCAWRDLAVRNASLAVTAAT